MTSTVLPGGLPATSMSQARLVLQSSTPWSPKKPKEQFTTVGSLDSKDASPVLVGLLAPEARLAVWSASGGLRKVKGAPEKGLEDATKTIACDASHTGLFLTPQRSNATLGFFLLTHDPTDPSRLVGKPRDFSESLQPVLNGLRQPSGERKSSTMERTAHCVCHTRLAVYERGEALVAALIQDSTTAQSFLLVGDLEHSSWRAWPLNTAFTQAPCVLLPSRFSDTAFVVSVLRAEVAHPVKRRLAVAAPSIPLALSVFDNVATAIDVDKTSADATADDTASQSRCLLVLEEAFSCDRGTGPGKEQATVRRCFQSQCFPATATVTTTAAPRVHLCAPTGTERTLTAVVTLDTEKSCLLQLHHTFGGHELVCACHQLPRGSVTPVSAATVRRADGTRLLLVLTDASELYACENLGTVMSVSVGAEPLNNRLALTQPVADATSKKSHKKSHHQAEAPVGAADQAVAAASLGARLVSLGDSSVACVSNALCAVFAIQDVRFDAASASRLLLASANASHAAAVQAVEQAADDRLEACTRLLMLRATGASDSNGSDTTATTTTTVALSPHELATVLFRDVLPGLAGVGAAHEEVELVQACYQAFLNVARCDTEADWLYLWTLTTILQRFLAHRTHDHSLRYTDRFFLDLAERRRRGTRGATAEDRRKSAEVVHDGVRAVLSEELVQAQKAKPRALPEELQYVLEGLADSATPLLALAEDVVRRYVETTTLSNGACVVRAKGGLSSCVHVVGGALLASCLDVPIYVYAVPAQQSLMWAMAQPDGSTSVHVLPQTYSSKQEFERALVLSTDLLSIASADETFRLDLVFLVLAMTRREHCLIALSHLYGPYLKAELSTYAPLSDNTQWMQNCAALGWQCGAPESLVALAFAGDPRVSLSSALFYAIGSADRRDGRHGGGGDAFSEPLFRSLSSVLSDEYGAVTLVLLAFLATGELLQAQNQQRESPAREGLVRACRHAMRAWAQVGRRLPYSLADVSASYAASLARSLQLPPGVSLSEARAEMSQGTSAALRAVVMCFRLTALMSYATTLEAKLAAIAGTAVVVPPAAELTERSPLIRDLLDALRITILLGGCGGVSPWSPDHMQTLFLRCIGTYGRAIAGVYPEWAVFFRRLLAAVTRATTCTLAASVTTERAQLEGLLTSLGAANESRERSDQAFAQAQRCGAQAEALAAHLLESTDTTSGRSARPYIFSHAEDSTLPRWPWLDDMVCEQQQQQHDVNGVGVDWVNNVWRLEEVPEMVTRLCEHTLDSIEAETVQAASTQPDTPSLSLSPTFLLPMYDSICRILPPVRAHAVIKEAPPQTRITQAPASRATGGDDDRGTAARAAPPPPALVASSSSVPQSPLRVAKNVASPHPQLSPTTTPAAEAVKVAAAKSPLSAAGHLHAQPSHLKAGQSTGAFSPSAVAWWETENNASRQTATTFDVSDASSSTSSSTATSYTTATTTTATANRNNNGNGEQRPCRRCGHCSCHHHTDTQRKTQRDDASARNSNAKLSARAACHPGYRDDNEDVRVLGPLGGGAFARREAWSADPAESGPTVAAPRPQLLQFTRLLRPPEDPRSRAAHSARAATPPRPLSDADHATSRGAMLRATGPNERRPQSARGTNGSGGGAAAQLLTFTTASRTAQMAHAGPAMRLHDARGLQPPQDPGMASGASRVSPFLTTATARTSARYMDPPPLPATAVFVEPPSLLHLGRTAPSHTERIGPQASTVAAPPDTYSGARREDASPFQSAATGASPFAHAAPPPGSVVLTFDAQGVHCVSEPSPSTAGMYTTAPVPVPTPQPPQHEQQQQQQSAAAATAGSPALNLPIPSLPQPTRVLNPTELTDFRRYTDELIAANRGAAERGVRGASVSSGMAPPLTTVESGVMNPDPSTATATPTASATYPLDSLKRENDFITQAQKIMEQREKDNEQFYQRVTDSVRSISRAIESSRQERLGLQPAEQSELLRTSIHQKNELLNLNRQLLDLQLEAARLGDAEEGYTRGGAGNAELRPPQFSVGTSTVGPAVTGNGTQTTSPLVGRSTQDGFTTMPPRTESGAASGKTMEDTFEDLRRLNAQLLSMNNSAEAMDKAIQETRDVIKRYEALSSVERMNADGVALLHSLQHRTAAVEQRLAGMPKPYSNSGTDKSTGDATSPVAAGHGAQSANRWRSSSTVFTPYSTTTTATPATASTTGVASPRFTSTSTVTTTTAPTSTSCTGAADAVTSRPARDDEHRRNTQPPQDSSGMPQWAAQTSSSVGPAARDHTALSVDEDVESDSDDARPLLGVAIGGAASAGRAEIVSMETLLHPSTAAADPTTPLRDRQRSVTFSESPARTRTAAAPFSAAAAGRRQRSASDVAAWGGDDAHQDRSPSPMVRPPPRPSLSALHPTQPSPAATASAQPRIFTAPSDLMSMYRTAPKHPRESVSRVSAPKRRPSMHTAPLLSTQAGSAASPYAQPRRQTLHATPATASGGSPSPRHQSTQKTSRRSLSTTGALTSDRFAMYAPASTKKSPAGRKATPPARLDARSLAMPADGDFDLMSSTAGHSKSTRQATSTTVDEKLSARRDTRREQSINQRIAMLEREFQ